MVMDPPWDIQMLSRSRAANTICRGDLKPVPYDTMKDEELLKFPIDDFAADTSSILVWTVRNKLPFTFKLLEAWGFTYHHTFIWHKNSGMTVHGIFINTEYCVFGYRGGFPRFGKGKAIPSMFSANTGKHSEKPDKFYEMIKTKFDAPRIDIFGRRRHDGYDIWGRQAESEAPTQKVLDIVQ